MLSRHVNWLRWIGLLLGLPALLGAGLAQSAACDPATACYDASLAAPALAGDFYLDGNLLAAGVNAARLTGAAGVPHTLEVRNIQEPGAAGFGDLYLYPDQSRPNQPGPAGYTGRVVFYPVKSYVKGELVLTCDPRGRRPADSVACRPTLDGAPQPDVAAGAAAVFNVPAGAHSVHTELVGDQANNWSPATRDDTVTVFAGRAYVQRAYLRASFGLKGLLKLSLGPAGALADFYVDGALVAQQTANAEAFVAPAAHQVEARAITDPAANGRYSYADTSQTVSVGAAGTRVVRFQPVKTWLTGALTVACYPLGAGAGVDVNCQVSVDGALLGSVAANQRATFDLATGAHALSVAAGGGAAAPWGTPVTAALTIVGGRTQFYNARLARSAPTPTPAPTPTTAPATGGGAAPSASGAGINHMGTEKVVLADYLMWYGPDVFDGTKTWDVPAAGPYNSDDAGTIQRHVAQAQQACLNGFAAHWYGPSEPRTTNNFNQLLAASAGTGLRHAVVLQTNILPGASEQSISDALNFVINTWAGSPNYLRLGGRPVIVFTDMSRPWGSDAAALQGWTRIRAAVDPNHNTIWMAEGLYPTYNPLFDGLYVYRIDHRDYPQSWLKQKRWADGLRGAARGNLPLGGLYFADTIAAGFDDTRAAAAGSDLRAPAPAFARDRRGGGYYTDTFNATANTGGDFLFVKSFNEWIEGTEIEPGATYGDLYLNLTCQFANAYRGR